MELHDQRDDVDGAANHTGAHTHARAYTTHTIHTYKHTNTHIHTQHMLLVFLLRTVYTQAP